MASRIIRSLLFITCLCSSGVGFGQSAPYWGAPAGGPYPGSYAPQQGYAPPGYGGYPAQGGHAHYGAMQTNYSAPLPGSREAIANEVMIPDSQLYPTDIWTTDATDMLTQKMSYALGTFFEHSWFRLEALHWDLDDPGRKILGANSAADQFGNPLDPTQIDSVFDGDGQLIGLGFTPTTDGISFNDNNGIRGTFGREEGWGTYRLSAWGIEEASERLDFTELLVPSFYLTTNLDTDGQPSNLALLADSYYFLDLESSLFGIDSEFRYNIGQWHDDMRVQAIVGTNFIQLHEVMSIRTGFNDQGAQPLLNSRIESDVKNNMLGPVLGLDFFFETPWKLSFGMTPKVILGVNQIRHKVRTRDLGFVGDTRTISEVNYELTPVLNLALYGKLQISQSVLLYASWDASWFTRVQRAQNGINFNDNTSTPLTDMGTNRSLNSFTVKGLTVGAEILLH